MKALKNFKDNWLVLVVVAVLSVASGMTTAEISKRNNKIHTAASVEYVDTENEKQDECILKKVDKSSFEKHEDRIDHLEKNKADKSTVDEIHADVREIRSQTFEILKILKDK